MRTGMQSERIPAGRLRTNITSQGAELSHGRQDGQSLGVSSVPLATQSVQGSQTSYPAVNSAGYVEVHELHYRTQ